MAGQSPDIAELFENVPEHPEPYEARVIKGTVPEWLDGTLLRNGPGIYTIGPDHYKHLFDGLSIIQRHRIHNGKVEYSTKYLRSDTYKKNMRAQRIVVSEFGTVGHPDPCKSIFSRYFCHFFPSKFTDNDLVAFVQCGDEVYASSETVHLNRVDPATLDAVEKVDMKKYVAINTVTAHPHYDSEGNTYNMGSALDSYKIVFVPKPETIEQNGNAFEKSKIIASIPSQGCNLSYYHSFGMSKNYVIFPEMPLIMRLPKMITAAFSLNPFSDAIQWYPKMQTKLHVVNIHTGTATDLKYTADSFFTFHHVNAYEENGCLVVDAVIYLDGSVVNDFDLDQIRAGHFPVVTEEKRPLLRRFVIPLSLPEGSKVGENLLQYFDVKTDAVACLTESGEIHCQFETLFNNGVELPRINYQYNASKYRFCYGAATSKNSHDWLGSKIYKFDVQKRTVLEWERDNPYQFASEPVFVASPEAKTEDDGVLLVPVTNLNPDESQYLLILDAKNLKELARAEIEPKIPVGFHGTYLPSKP